jgi:hypothetical protein
MRTYRGIFWPAVLILVGVIALLANAGLISTDRLSLLTDMWPLILIVIGLVLIVQRRFQGAAANLATLLIVVIAVGGALAYAALAPNPTTTHSLDSTAAVGNLDHASLEMNVGAATITVEGSTLLEADLYRAHIDYSGSRPDVSLNRSDGSLRISQGANGPGFFGTRHLTIRLQINPGLPWSITTNSGASTGTYNLAAAHIGSLELNTGASHEDITLGRPSGVVPVTINGGSVNLHLHRPAGTSALVRVSGGAVSLNFDGRENHAIGTVEQTTGASTNMYRVEVNGGQCTVTMDVTASTA